MAMNAASKPMTRGRLPPEGGAVIMGDIQAPCAWTRSWIVWTRWSREKPRAYAITLKSPKRTGPWTAFSPDSVSRAGCIVEARYP
jgi:hypothetical protein